MLYISFNSSYLIWDILLYEYAIELCNFKILIINSNLWEIQTLIIDVEVASNITFYLLETICTLSIFQKLFFLLNCFETKKSIPWFCLFSENCSSFLKSKNALLGSTKFKIYSFVGLHYKKKMKCNLWCNSCSPSPCTHLFLICCLVNY